MLVDGIWNNPANTVTVQSMLQFAIDNGYTHGIQNVTEAESVKAVADNFNLECHINPEAWANYE